MPANSGPEIDIARNIRAIEWVKAEMVDGMAALFKALIKNSEEAIVDALAAIIIGCYLLARRLGLNLNKIERRIEHKIQSEIHTEHELESWYGDFSNLLQHMEGKNPR
jgi:hypothetical protein